jgi:hypothetical protein
VGERHGGRLLGEPGCVGGGLAARPRTVMVSFRDCGCRRNDLRVVDPHLRERCSGMSPDSVKLDLWLEPMSFRRFAGLYRERIRTRLERFRLQS